MSEQESDTRPLWMVALEKQLEAVKQTRRLGHELGAGSKCMKCHDGCPGLELHYWRKKCLKCKCNKEDHNVQDETDLRFEILLFKDKNQTSNSFNGQELYNMMSKMEPSKCEELNSVLKETAHKGPVLFDWVPPNVSNEIAAEYMIQLPVDKMPVSKSSGAQQRSLQLGKQIPLHDIDPAVWYRLPADAQKGFQKYLQDIHDNAVGQGKIERISQKEYIAESVNQNVLVPNHTGTLKPIAQNNQTFGNYPGLAQYGNNDVKNHNVPNKRNLLYASSTQTIICCGRTPPKPSANTVADAKDSEPEKRHPIGGLSPTTESFIKMMDEVYNIYPKKQEYSGEETPLYCVQCKGTILMNTVAIVTDRAGPCMKWHPQCFVCNICDELLVDMIYFFYKQKVYCGRHYAAIKKILRCHACDELIFVDVYTMAEGKAYHVGHFCCSECDVELGGKKYLLHQEQNICLPCFEAKYSKMCRSCGTAIKPDEQGVNIHDNHWHATSSCFVCNTCGRSLIGLKIITRSGTPFCSKECVVNV